MIETPKQLQLGMNNEGLSRAKPRRAVEDPGFKYSSNANDDPICATPQRGGVEPDWPRNFESNGTPRFAVSITDGSKSDQESTFENAANLELVSSTIDSKNRRPNHGMPTNNGTSSVQAAFRDESDKLRWLKSEAETNASDREKLLATIDAPRWTKSGDGKKLSERTRPFAKTALPALSKL